MKRIVILYLTISMCILSSCAEFTHLTRTKRIDNNTKAQSVFIDAKQRAVISNTVTETNYESVATDFETQISVDSQGNNNTDADGNVIYFEIPTKWEIKENKTRITQFCAEPSPDALSAIAASQGFSISKPDVGDLSQSLGFSEGAASIGLRTQSIQLMRDSMYRICEGYISGAINKPTYQALQRRLQNSMVAIVAIEQLTGALRAPAVALGSNAVVGAAELIGKYTQLTEESRAKVQTAQTNVAELTTALKETEDALTNEKSNETKAQEELTAADTALQAAIQTGGVPTGTLTVTLEQKKTELTTIKEEINKKTDAKNKAEKALEEANTTLKERQTTLDSYQSALQASRSGSGTSSVQVSIEQGVSGRSLTDASAIAVSNNVKEIVTKTLDLNFNEEACSSVILNMGWNEHIQPGSFAQECLKFIQAKTKLVATVTQLSQSQLNSTSTVSVSPASSTISVQNVSETIQAVTELIKSL